MVFEGYNGVRTEFIRGRITKSGENEYVCKEKVLKCPCEQYRRYAKQNSRYAEYQRRGLILKQRKDEQKITVKVYIGKGSDRAREFLNCLFT